MDIVDEEIELPCAWPDEAAPSMDQERNDRRSSKTVSGKNSSRGVDVNRSSSVRSMVADSQHLNKTSDTSANTVDVPLTGGKEQLNSTIDAASLLRVAGELSECKLPPYGMTHVLDTSRLASGETSVRGKEASAYRNGAQASPCQPVKTCWYQTGPENEHTGTFELSSHRAHEIDAPQFLTSPVAERAHRPQVANRTRRAIRAKKIAGKRHIKIESKPKREATMVATSSKNARTGSWYTYCGDGFNCVVSSDNIARKANLASPVKKEKKEKKETMVSSDNVARNAKLASRVKTDKEEKENMLQKKTKSKVKCLLNKNKPSKKSKIKVECLLNKDKPSKRSKPSKRGKISKNSKANKRGKTGRGA
eukprot:gene16584-19701_t